MRRYKMKKLVLLVLLSVMGVGVAAENAHAIFGGIAWRAHYRRNGAGFFRGRRSVSVERKGPIELQYARAAVDAQLSDWKYFIGEED
jgi:hypothetical protein